MEGFGGNYGPNIGTQPMYTPAPAYATPQVYPLTYTAQPVWTGHTSQVSQFPSPQYSTSPSSVHPIPYSANEQLQQPSQQQQYHPVQQEPYNNKHHPVNIVTPSSVPGSGTSGRDCAFDQNSFQRYKKIIGGGVFLFGALLVYVTRFV